MKNSVCVVLISYNSTQEIVENVNALIPQVAEIFIVDNGSSSDSLSILEELSKKSSVKIKYNPTNLGIATALNQGVNYASENRYEWVATFDQDSLAPANYIQTMMNAYYSCENNESVAIIAPRYQTNTGIISFSTQKNDDLIFSKIKTTIASGNLVKVEAFDKVGLFEDSFFIDYVDHEFCLRIRKHGLYIIESHKSILYHHIGNSLDSTFLGLKIVTTHHTAIRRYYKYRNLMVFIKRYFYYDPAMIIVTLKVFLFEPLKILFFEKDKKNKIYHIIKGIYHGINGIGGSID